MSLPTYGNVPEPPQPEEVPLAVDRPFEQGVFNRTLRFTSDGAWPPQDLTDGDIMIGPTALLGDASTTYSYEERQGGWWAWPPVGLPPPDETLVGAHRSVYVAVFNTKEVTAESVRGQIAQATLYLDYQGQMIPPARAWSFSMPAGSLDRPSQPFAEFLGSSGDITSTNTIYQIGWVGGMHADLPEFDPNLSPNDQEEAYREASNHFHSILIDAARRSPFQHVAAEIDLKDLGELDYETGWIDGTGMPRVMEIPLEGWVDFMLPYEWVGLMFAPRDAPDIFWGYQDVLFSSGPGGPEAYAGRNWIGFEGNHRWHLGDPIYDMYLSTAELEEEEDEPTPRYFEANFPGMAINLMADFGGMDILHPDVRQHKILIHRAQMDRNRRIGAGR